MPMLILLVASLLSSQQASMRCVGGASAIAATQTQPLRSPDGVIAVLKVSSDDDHGKDSHLCRADYVLLFSPADGGPTRTVDLLTTDADWNRTLSLRLDGFAHNGKRVFGVLTELGKYSSTMVFAYDPTAGKVQLIDLKKQFPHVVTAKCNPRFGVVGTTETGAIVVELSSSKRCAADGRWLVNPTHGSVHRVPRGASVEPLFTSAVDVAPGI